MRGSLDPVDRGSFRSGLLQNGFEAEDREDPREGDTKDPERPISGIFLGSRS